MVGRPKAENPRTRLIGVRVTEAEGEVLDAMAALDRTTVAEIVRQGMQRSILAAMQDEHVKEMISLQHRHTKRSSADVVVLKPQPITDIRQSPPRSSRRRASLLNRDVERTVSDLEAHYPSTPNALSVSHPRPTSVRRQGSADGTCTDTEGQVCGRLGH